MSRQSRFLSILAVASVLSGFAGAASAQPTAPAGTSAPPTPSASAAPPAPPAPPAISAPAAAGAAATQRPAAGTAAAGQSLEHAAGLARAGKFKEAIAELEALRKAGKADTRALSLLGTLYVQIKKPNEAMAILHPLIDSSQAEAATLYNAGRAELMLKRPTLAQDYFQRSVALDVASPAARELGLIFAHQGRVVEAYALLRPWSLHYPTDGEALLTAATLAIELERPLEAEQMIAGMKLDDPAIVLLRGKILIEKADGRSAVALLTPLAASHPKGMELEIKRTLAEADLLAGQPKQAEALLAGITGGRPSLALLLAQAQHRGGNPVAALATLKPFADLLPNDPKGAPDPRVAGGVAVEYGRLLAETGHPQDGITFLERATRIEPDRQEVWQALGQALTAAGRKDEALKAEARATALAPPVKPAGQ